MKHDKNDPFDDGPPPFTLEEAEKWLHFVEDVATIESNLGFATRLILVNLVRTLTSTGALDGKSFVNLIRENLYQVENPSERIGSDALLDHIERALAAPYEIPCSILFH